jgi:hypothetical protein
VQFLIGEKGPETGTVGSGEVALPRRADWKALIGWETGYEVDNLGFNIYSQEGAERSGVSL